jgi:electron transport complex protein RnfE
MLNLRDNPLLLYALGICPALAVCTRVDNALVMGLLVLVVLMGTSLIMAALEPVLPEALRLPLALVAAAGLVTAGDLFLRAYLPGLRGGLGIYVQLVAVNCLLVGRTETGRRRLAEAAPEAFGQGVGFCLGLLLVALVREVLGAGTISLFPFGSFSGTLRIGGLAEQPVRVLLLAPGALLVLGYLAALYNRSRS